MTKRNPWGREIVEQRRDPWGRTIIEATPRPEPPADTVLEEALKAQIGAFYQRRYSSTIEGGRKYADQMAARLTREAIAEGKGHAGYLAKLREQAEWSTKQAGPVRLPSSPAQVREVRRIEEPWRPRSA